MSILHTNPDLPIWLGSGNEATVKLTAELCDGWLPLHFVPGRMAYFKPWVEEGFRRAGGGKSWKDFEIQASGRVVITEDISAALQQSKPQAALYVGGMGHPTHELPQGPDAPAGLSRGGRAHSGAVPGRPQRRSAIEAVPDEYVDEAGLYGSPERIASAGRPGRNPVSPGSRSRPTRRRPCAL